MSLMVWLPLNGDLKNQGLSGELTTVGTPTYVNGKIGKGLSSGGCTMSAAISKNILNNETLSICCWIYPNAGEGTISGILFGTDSMGENNNRKFSIFLYPTINDLHLSWQNDTANSTFFSSTDHGLFPSYTWTHLAVIYNNPNVYIYINGVLKKTYTNCVSNSSSFEYNTPVIHNNSTRIINDFRIYNHALSAKEVKEIAKGLILHYPLNDIYNGQPNKYSSPYCDGYMSDSGGFVCTALTNERGYNYKMTYTGTGSNAWKSLCVPNYSFTIGKTYYYSVKIRCNKWTGDELYLRASRSNNDWVTRMALVCSSSLADGQWHEYYTYQTINGTYDRAGSTVTCTPVLEFYTNGCATNGFIYDFDFDIKDVQVIESDEYVPFQEGQWNTNIVSDCSGFGNNGTCFGTLTYSADYVRYNNCLEFSAKSHIKIPKPLAINNASQFTISMWVKPKSGCGGYATVVSNYNNPSSGFWMAINTEGSGAWFYNGTYAKNTPLLAIDSWSHISIVFNAGEVNWYINGLYIITGNVNSKTTQFTDYIAIGNSYTGTTWNTDFVGSISDFRFYATALSADDIKKLYSAPISIDKSGNLFAYEFMEV